LHCLDAFGFSAQQKWHQEFEYDLLGWSQSTLNCIMPYPNLLLGHKLSEYNTGYRAFSREILEHLPLDKYSNDFVTVWVY
jgi:hypothetical protein